MNDAITAVTGAVDLAPALTGIGAVAAAAILLSGAVYGIRKIRGMLAG